MTGRIRFTGQLSALGYSSSEIRRLVRTGELIKVRRGAYVDGPDAVGLDERADHRRLIEATLARCGPEVVVSDMSAAALHLLPLWSEDLIRVHLTRDRPGTTKLSQYVHLRGLDLPAEDVVQVDGIAATSLARTVLDLTCRLPLDRAVAVGDAALRLGLDPYDLEATRQRAGRRIGIGSARRAIALLDGRSETVGESRSRTIFALHDLPVPIPQFEITDRTGRFVARCDFGWPELRTVGEFDGKTKYQRKLRPDHDPEEELFREKQREDAIRELGWQVVRWTTRDLYPPTELLARLQRAFDRGRQAA